MSIFTRTKKKKANTATTTHADTHSVVTEGALDGAIAASEHAIGEQLLRGLAEVPGIRVFGASIDAPRVALASVVVEGVHAHDAGQVLDNLGIAARVGHHCAQPLHRRLGVAATTRASAYLYTTEAEVDLFLDALSGVRAYFGAGR